MRDHRTVQTQIAADVTAAEDLFYYAQSKSGDVKLKTYVRAAAHAGGALRLAKWHNHPELLEKAKTVYNMILEEIAL